MNKQVDYLAADGAKYALVIDTGNPCVECAFINGESFGCLCPSDAPKCTQDGLFLHFEKVEEG